MSGLGGRVVNRFCVDSHKNWDMRTVSESVIRIIIRIIPESPRIAHSGIPRNDRFDSTLNKSLKAEL
jgi:hypothetical protein